MDLNRFDAERALYDGEPVRIHMTANEQKQPVSHNQTLILIIGESGSGKDSIVSEATRRFGYHQAMSYTTRQPRYPGESTHYFVDDEAFEALRDQMVATTVFDGCKYGCTYEELDHSEFYIVDVKGAQDVLNAVKAGKIHRTVLIVYIFAFEATRKQRMLERGDTPNQVFQRIVHDRENFKWISCLPITKVVWNCGALYPCVEIVCKLLQQGSADNVYDASEGFITC